MYQLVFTKDAQKQLAILAKKAPNAIKKLEVLLQELREHPRTGTGQVEQLKHCEPPIKLKRTYNKQYKPINRQL